MLLPVYAIVLVWNAETRTKWNKGYLQSALESFLFCLEVFVEPACPVTDNSDVQADGISLLWGRAYGERVPLKGGNGRNIDEDVVPGLEGKMWRPFDDQRHHFWGQDHARRYPRLALIWQTFGNPSDFFDGKNYRRYNEPFPEVWSMDN